MRRPGNRSKDEDTDITVSLARRVQHGRAMRGRHAKECAAELKVSVPQYQKYENGTDRIPVAMLWRLSVYLKIPAGWFFDGIPAAQSQTALGDEWENEPTNRNLRQALALIPKLPEDMQRAAVHMLETAVAFFKKAKQ